jgi:hypothetical protein
MKVHRLTTYGPMRSRRVLLSPQEISVHPQEKPTPDSLTGIRWSGHTSIPPEGVEYQLWGFTKPTVVVPRDKLVRNP